MLLTSPSLYHQNISTACTFQFPQNLFFPNPDLTNRTKVPVALYHSQYPLISFTCLKGSNESAGIRVSLFYSRKEANCMLARMRKFLVRSSPLQSCIFCY